MSPKVGEAAGQLYVDDLSAEYSDEIADEDIYRPTFEPLFTAEQFGKLVS